MLSDNRANARSKTKDKYTGTGGTFEAYLMDAGAVDTTDATACLDTTGTIVSVAGPFSRGHALSVFTRFVPAAGNS